MEEYIKKTTAIKAIQRAAELNNATARYLYGFQDAAEAVMELPAEQPERKPGQWLPDKTNAYRFICSECKRSFEVDTVMMQPVWNFCPDCGANMGVHEHG